MSPRLLQVNEQGFSMIPAVLSEEDAVRLRESLEPVSGAGRRGMLAMPEVRSLANSTRIRELVSAHLKGTPRAVRAIYFDKSPESNWLVAWHQDLTIAVKERAEVAGFGPWSTKDGTAHVQPPITLLEQMITVRIHLDAADSSNGALRVIPGSHLHGRLDAEQIEQLRQANPEHLCAAACGDALLMRPLILHASGRCLASGHRRILHIEYAGFDLPSEMRWAEDGQSSLQDLVSHRGLHSDAAQPP